MRPSAAIHRGGSIPSETHFAKRMLGASFGRAELIGKVKEPLAAEHKKLQRPRECGGVHSVSYLLYGANGYGG